jgi:hypothetical protein
MFPGLLGFSCDFDLWGSKQWDLPPGWLESVGLLLVSDFIVISWLGVLALTLLDYGKLCQALI